ncbi:PREDICTED: probable ribonuclease 11 [Elephantulus edwardii]|uniref:probable ribonuclease 11 n=1 Tax=Elephantulus edwardii TaxID=28737 RepID=UPI0003F090D2|nr:PREDICTED: probable ribonuclease 11 [Elephantulus edwardii]
METFSLLLLDLGLILTGNLESTMEIVNGDFSEEKAAYNITKSGEGKQTIEVSMNLTLLDKNTRLSKFKDVIPSALKFKKLHYNFPKISSNEYCNVMMIERIELEANRSYILRNNLIHGTIERIRGIHKISSCKWEPNLGMVRGHPMEPHCDKSPELDTTMPQLSIRKHSLRCQYQSITSFKKMLTVLASHSLMSWLVNACKL